MILSFEKPPKSRSTEKHNENFQSDTGIPGTYVPNMSEAWRRTFKAKHIKGDDPRIEIRKGLDNGVQVLIIVREGGKEGLEMSANGKMKWKAEEWGALTTAIYEAVEHLRRNR
jgi:hypothetical protein